MKRLEKLKTESMALYPGWGPLEAGLIMCVWAGIAGHVGMDQTPETVALKKLHYLSKKENAVFFSSLATFYVGFGSLFFLFCFLGFGPNWPGLRAYHWLCAHDAPGDAREPSGGHVVLVTELGLASCALCSPTVTGTL